MKKLLLSSIVLFLFSASILIFQVSCKKEAKAESPTASEKNNESLILYTVYDKSDNGMEYWLIDIDGNNRRKIPINLPDNLVLDSDGGSLINEGQTLIFLVSEKERKADGSRVFYIYSCSTDGSKLKKVADCSKHAKPSADLDIIGAF